MSGTAELPLTTLLVFAFALGTCVGSFLNVVIHRVPLGESIVRPRSRCPDCGGSIPAWANLPLVSYALLRGRCRGCGRRISARYPLVEALTGILFCALLYHDGVAASVLIKWLLGAALIAIAFIDYAHHRIPNVFTYPGILLGLVLALVAPFLPFWIGSPPWYEAVAGVVIAGGMMWLVSAYYEWRTGRIGLGMGDVKLVAMLGGFLGIQAVLGVMVLGSLLGLAHGLFLIAREGAGWRTRIPFGPALAVAGIIHLFDPNLLPRLVSGA